MKYGGVGLAIRDKRLFGTVPYVGFPVEGNNQVFS